MRPFYRVRQGLGRLSVALCPKRLDRTPAQELLPAPLWRIFTTMPRGDQWHGLCVCRRLMAEGHDEPALLAAALLHDVGKAEGGLTLAHRTAIILTNALAPRQDWLDRLGAAQPGSWRYPFYVQRHHAALGAARLREAGADAAIVSLVGAHEPWAASLAPELEPLRCALIAADEAC